MSSSPRVTVLILATLIGCGHGDSTVVDARAAEVSAPDAGGADGPAPDASPVFACGSAYCDDASQYCYQRWAGGRSAAPEVGCNDLPPGCLTAPSCDCVRAAIGDACPGALSCQ